MDKCDTDPSYNINPRGVGFNFLCDEVLVHGSVSELALEKLGGGEVLNSEEQLFAVYTAFWERIHRIAGEKVMAGIAQPTVVAADI